MTGKYSIRAYRKSDLEMLLFLHLAEFRNIGETYEKGKSFFESPKIQTLVLFKKSTREVVGYYAFTLRRQKYFLSWISISKKWRGRGLGEYLIRDLIRRAKRNRIREISLASRNRFKAAIKTYINCNFEITKTFKGRDGDTMIGFSWYNRR